MGHLERSSGSTGQPVRIFAALRHGVHAAAMLRLEAAWHAARPIRRVGLCAVAESMLAFSVGARGAVGALGAVVMGAKVDSLAAEGAAVVDKFLVFLDGHVDWCDWCDGD
jgi:phenylacetate-coenzyme A ligase PaaK-like adenylate-forming protein